MVGSSSWNMIQTAKDKTLDMIKGHFTSTRQGRGILIHSKRLEDKFISLDMRNGLFSGDHIDYFNHH